MEWFWLVEKIGLAALGVYLFVALVTGIYWFVKMVFEEWSQRRIDKAHNVYNNFIGNCWLLVKASFLAGIGWPFVMPKLLKEISPL